MSIASAVGVRILMREGKWDTVFATALDGNLFLIEKSGGMYRVSTK